MAGAVHGRDEGVEHGDVMTQRQQPVAGVRANEARSAGDQDLDARCPFRLAAASRYTSRVDAAVAAQVNSAARLRPASRSRSRPPLASAIARAMDAGSAGSARTAAPPAVSGMAVVFEVTTGQPQAIASRIGSPKVSFSDGYTEMSAPR